MRESSTSAASVCTQRGVSGQPVRHGGLDRRNVDFTAYCSVHTWSRQDVEDIELATLDTAYTTPFLKYGLQVHMPYMAYAHWLLLHRILAGAGVEQVQVNTDIDSMSRAAFLSVFADEINRGDAHAFFVNYAKWQTIDERERIQKESKRAQAAFRATLPEAVREDSREVGQRGKKAVAA